jgi:polysaccharide pyruvyl transferase WcaK-like protein
LWQESTCDSIHASDGNETAHERGSTSPAPELAVKIVLEQGGYAFRNLGDLAMLQVAIERLRSLWPDAQISVLTSEPQRLKAACPGTHPLPLRGRDLACGPYSLLGRLKRFSGDLERRLVQELHPWSYPLLSLKLRLRESEDRLHDMRQYVSAIREADLVVATGGGYLTDAFPDMVRGVCATLRLAQVLGKPTALFSQGVGPLARPELRRVAGSVLRRADLVALREGIAGPPLLRDIGRPAGRAIHVTGDDAVSLARRATSDSTGEALGINLRLAPYAGMGPDDLAGVRTILAGFGRSRGVRFQPLPISFFEEENDARVIRRLLDGIQESDGGTGIRSPEHLADATARCRLVITGSYHAGVFALAQGVPVIPLVQSPYYLAKFRGLAAQFGEGCRPVLLHETSPASLGRTIDELWHRSDELRDGLLRRADEQIALSAGAYGSLAASLSAEPATSIGCA